MDKIQTTRKILREKIEQFKRDKQAIQPLIGKLTDQTKQLQEKVLTVFFWTFLYLEKHTS